VSATTASNNVVIGFTAGHDLSTGGNNTFIGESSGYANTTGNGNTTAGKNSGDSITTGENNAFVGLRAGHTVTTGSNNVCVGYEAGADNTSNNNQLFIARAATGASNAGTWIYGASNGACRQGNNATTWTQTSDERIKKNIVDSPNGLAKINALKVRNFNYRTEEEITVEGLTGCDATGLQVGVIAQEVETVLPESVSESDSGQKQVQTDPIFWSMIKAIQELSEKDVASQTLIASLAARITALEA